MLENRVDDGNGAGLDRHGDRCVQFDHALRHGGLKADGPEEEIQRFRKRHVAHGEGDFRVFKHLLQQCRLRTDGAIFAANKDQVIRNLEIIVTGSCQVTAKYRQGGATNAADRIAKSILDFGIKIAKRGQDHVFELQPSGNQNAGTLKAALVGDGKLLGFCQITGFGIGAFTRLVLIDRVIAEELCQGGQEILVLQAVWRVPDLDQLASRQHFEAFRRLGFVNALDRGNHALLQNLFTCIHRQIRWKPLRGAAAIKQGRGKADRACSASRAKPCKR